MEVARKPDRLKSSCRGRCNRGHGQRRSRDIIAGVHPGCYELFAHDDIRSIVGLKGKTVGWSRSYVSSRSS